MGRLGAVLDIAGIACSFAGVVLMLRYSLPFHLPQINGKALSEPGHVEDGRRNLIGLSGLMLFGFGTLVQIFAVLMQ